MTDKEKKKSFETLCVHAGYTPDQHFGSVMPPVHLTSTYVQSEAGVPPVYDYARLGNPTRANLEECLSELEGGSRALACASGCAAATTVMGLFRAGDHIICCDDVYGGTYRLFQKIFGQLGLSYSFVDLTSMEALEAAHRAETKAIWIETPTNPLLKLIDLEQVLAWSKKKDMLSIVDNTFMTPILQSPFQYGADIVLHSTTKYLNGHSDVIGGALVVKDEDLGEKLHFLHYSMGTNQAPFDAWLVLRGIKTLALRMERHQQSAMQLAHFLEEHPRIRRVIYPGLESHPQHALAEKQMRGFGGMISFEIDGGLDDAKCFLARTEVFTLAESLGGVESLVEHPAIMTHASVPPEIREKLGISDSLIRVSVGIENVDDLQADLEQALKA